MEKHKNQTGRLVKNIANRLVKREDGDWDESSHSRVENGQFGGGSPGSPAISHTHEGLAASVGAAAAARSAAKYQKAADHASYLTANANRSAVQQNNAASAHREAARLANKAGNSDAARAHTAQADVHARNSTLGSGLSGKIGTR